MMKRLGIAVLVLTVLVAGMAGVVLAQDNTPPPANTCPNAGACGGNGAGGPGMRGYGDTGSMPTLLSEALGITTEEFRAARAAGQTVAEMATAQGVELSDVVAAVIAPRAERLAQAVADGRLTQEQADTMLATMTEQMTSHFQEQATFGGGCGMQGGGNGHRGGMRGGRWSAPQAPDTQAPSSGL